VKDIDAVVGGAAFAPTRLDRQRSLTVSKVYVYIIGWKNPSNKAQHEGSNPQEPRVRYAVNAANGCINNIHQHSYIELAAHSLFLKPIRLCILDGTG
jgi:hypothetical protein